MSSSKSTPQRHKDVLQREGRTEKKMNSFNYLPNKKAEVSLYESKKWATFITVFTDTWQYVVFLFISLRTDTGNNTLTVQLLKKYVM